MTCKRGFTFRKKTHNCKKIRYSLQEKSKIIKYSQIKKVDYTHNE